MKIVGTGVNTLGVRLITIEVPPTSKLFKLDDDCGLPLLVGRYKVSGDTFQQEDRFFIQPKKGPDEQISDFIKRLEDHRLKMNQLNQWFLTTRSRDRKEDKILLDQLSFLDALPEVELDRVLQLSTFEYFPPINPDLSGQQAILNIIQNLTQDPLQMGPDALRLQIPGNSPGKTLSKLTPLYLDGMGFQIQTWNYNYVEVAFLGCEFKWMAAQYTEIDGDGFPEWIPNPEADQIIKDYYDGLGGCH